MVPNSALKQEYTYNNDLGASKLTTEIVKLELSGFYTWFRNAIVKAPYTLNGQDSQNANKACVLGMTAAVSADPGNYFSVLSTLTLTRCRFDTDDSKTSAVYQQQPDGNYAPIQANVSGKLLDQYNADSEDNAQYATKDGMPCWITCNLRGQVGLHPFASGFSAQGRNLVIALRASF